MKKYTLLDHTADIGIEAWGDTKEEALAATVEAMFDLIVDNESVAMRDEKKIIASGVDEDDMLMNLLREALYLFHGKSWLCKTCELLEMNEEKMSARLLGEPYDTKKHQLKMEIKAVTYHTLKIEKREQGWRARVIFDV
ncbi:MAG TPA: archease [Smithellaceae bacterium]|nr:archease [Smithellaceae bacterium]HRS90121.1 archease [Smithellaceae bacterium]HRV26986.1 archease [Smithellaceae bacterium]